MTILKSLVAVAFVFSTQQAFACSYDPQINLNKRLLFAEAVKEAVQKISFDVDALSSVQTETKFEETKPTRMCPNEIQYTNTYTLTWTTGKDLAMSKPCSAAVTVVKTVNYEKKPCKAKSHCKSRSWPHCLRSIKDKT